MCTETTYSQRQQQHSGFQLALVREPVRRPISVEADLAQEPQNTGFEPFQGLSPTNISVTNI